MERADEFAKSLREYGIESLIIMHEIDPIANIGDTYFVRQMHLATSLGVLEIVRHDFLKDSCRVD